MLLQLAEKFPDHELFKNSADFEKVVFIDADGLIENKPQMLKHINNLLVKMTQLFAIKNHVIFQKYFGIGEERDPGADFDDDEMNADEMVSGSLLRQVASGRD